MERPKRRRTSPGLGDTGLRAKQAPTSGIRERLEEPLPPSSAESAGPFSGDVPIERAEKLSSRPPRSRRQRNTPAVRVDEVGEVAVAIATRASQSPSAPRLLKTRGELADAPLDHRDAFVLSLIDGATNLEGLVDLAAMPEKDVVSILERLARLGIVSLV